MSFGNPSFLTRQWFYRWHRRIGLTSAFLVVILVITGILLNHTEALQLDSRFSQSSLLRKAYGLPARLEIQAVTLDQSVISQFEDTLYINTRPIDICPGQLIGAVRLPARTGLPSSLLSACSSGLLWHTGTGEYLDYIAADAIGAANISRLGISAGQQPVIADGSTTLRIDLDDLSTVVIGADAVSWSQLREVDTSTAARLTDAYYRSALSWEQVLLDLHSGRLLGGNFGVLLMDASAVVLLLLVISGIYMWWIKRP